ncbi:uncharacterized protein LOC111638144 [Centruroides sculpturatus]|uniref:uncharacterized protein LOC111638144 n=1 Tax=Centruroides sculpturatus TaxID=218467 RepID=UPI000C6E86F4|nr:uncharacterized protein LOC111638144 [Centruroides sculpturatus]
MKIIATIFLLKIIQAIDPESIMYPGQVNLGLLAPLQDFLGRSKMELVRSTMACVWSVNEVNSRKEARELNLGIHLYDTCNRQDVAQRQVFRLTEHLGHIQIRGCTNDRGPPIAGVITLGNSSIWETPVKILEAFSVPLMTTENGFSNIITTSYSPLLLARCLVSLCSRAGWYKVGFINIDLFDETTNVIKEEALQNNITVEILSYTNISAINRSMSVQTFVIMSKNIIAANEVIKLLQEFKLVLFLTEKATNFTNLLNLTDSTNEDLIVITPEILSVSGFEDYWKKELNEGNISKHPLIARLSSMNETLEDNYTSLSKPISDEIKIIWTFSECLKNIQKKKCSYGSDCISLIKESLNSDIFNEMKTINFTISNVFDERNVTVRFDRNGKLATERFNIYLIGKDNTLQIGYYDEDDDAPNANGLFLTLSDIFLIPNHTDTANTNKPRSSSLLSPPGISRLFYGTDPMQNSTDIPLNADYKKKEFQTLLGTSGLGIWVSRPWSLTVIVLSTVGILSTIYIISFLLMKSCEGALKKRNLPLMFLTLLSVLLLFGSSIPFIFRPSTILCGITRVCHNITLALLSACLLLHAMHLRSQELLGLGGRVSRLNQFITLGFIIGIQIALEVQFWLFETPKIFLVDDVPFCSVSVNEYVTSQIYIAYVIVIGLVVAFTSRNVPYNHREGHCLWITQIVFLIAFVSKTCLYCFLKREVKDMIMSLSLIVIAYIILGGIFIPYLYEVHRQGGLPHKPLSYAESMSTVFTMFKQDGESISGESTTSRGKKAAKTLDKSEGMVEMTHNPLYDDFRSVYT